MGFEYGNIKYKNFKCENLDMKFKMYEFLV